VKDQVGEKQGEAWDLSLKGAAQVEQRMTHLTPYLQDRRDRHRGGGGERHFSNHLKQRGFQERGARQRQKLKRKPSLNQEEQCKIATAWYQRRRQWFEQSSSRQGGEGAHRPRVSLTHHYRNAPASLQSGDPRAAKRELAREARRRKGKRGEEDIGNETASDRSIGLNAGGNLAAAEG